MFRTSFWRIRYSRAEKSYDAQEVDIREKIREADYEEESFRQWEYSPDDDEDYTMNSTYRKKRR